MSQKLLKICLIYLATMFLAILSYTYFIKMIKYASHEDTTSLSVSFDNCQKVSRINEAKMDMIFVVGNPGSGTTLMRTILDVSPRINCGNETKIIPKILEFLINFKQNFSSKAGYYMDSIDSAMGLFLTRILENNLISSNVDIMCTKDPQNIDYIDYLHYIFPHAKIVYMVRDGRGAALSIMKRMSIPKTTQKFYNFLTKWNTCNAAAYAKCIKIGPKHCKIIKYEDLVTKSEQTIRDLLIFLNLEFSKSFLRHQDADDQIIFATNQTRQGIYTDMLKSWRGMIEYDKVFVQNNFTMMHTFGYEIDFNDEMDGIVTSS